MNKKMMIIIFVCQIKNGQIIGDPTTDTILIKKFEKATTDDSITIGRDADCKVMITAAFMTRKHGKIWCTKKGFLIKKEIFNYQDSSTNGTKYLPTGVMQVKDAIRIHNETVEIQNGSMLLFLGNKEVGKEEGFGVLIQKQ